MDFSNLNSELVQTYDQFWNYFNIMTIKNRFSPNRGFNQLNRHSETSILHKHSRTYAH